MARKDLERLIGRAVLDPEFRERLFADPEKVIREEGFDLTEKQIAGLKAVDVDRAKALIDESMELTKEPWAN